MWPPQGDRCQKSRFFGIVIRMFVEAGGSHRSPHLHGYYQEHVGAWAEMHQDELLANWKTLQDGRPAFKIEPLTCEGRRESRNPQSRRI